MKKNPGSFGYIGDNTTQFYGGYHRPLQGSLWNNQDFVPFLAEKDRMDPGHGKSMLMAPQLPQDTVWGGWSSRCGGLWNIP